jgi:hypothetical protein
MAPTCGEQNGEEGDHHDDDNDNEEQGDDDGQGAKPCDSRSPGSRSRCEALGTKICVADRGASLPEVQRLLGHADLSTTQVYLKVSGRGLEEAALSNPARALLLPRSPGPG